MVSFRPSRTALVVSLISMLVGFGGLTDAQAAPKQKKTTSKAASPVVAAATQYVNAMASGDKVGVGRLDFACLYRMVEAAPKGLTRPLPENDPVYAACWTPIAAANDAAVERRDLDMDVLWPGKDRLLFFGRELHQYATSAFVMDLVGQSPPGSGLTAEFVDAKPLPRASFRLRKNVLPATATAVHLRITYKDPLSSPATYAAGTFKWTNTIRRPRQALKSITLRWVVLSGLRKHGFPTDVAVLNLPVSTLGQQGQDLKEAIPFVTVPSGAEPETAVWFGPADAPGLLIAAVGRAALFPEQLDRIAMLNRVLIIDPMQPEALTRLTRDLYESILRDAAAAHKFHFSDPVLATRFDELYWDTYAQTTRMDLSLGKEMGGFTKETTADALYRMIPAMEKLVKIRPEDVENRLRLGIAYRWNNDQDVTILTLESLLNDVPKERTAFRARVLVHLAWSRINKVAWNRHFNDPLIVEGYQAAEQAASMTDSPVEKFMTAYTLGYSLAFMPQRDNQKMVEHLSEARRLFLQLSGATPEAWNYLLSNDTLKGLVASDPMFKPLLATT